eukprot:6453926-Prymnesium_polylepis.1
MHRGSIGGAARRSRRDPCPCACDAPKSCLPAAAHPTHAARGTSRAGASTSSRARAGSHATKAAFDHWCSFFSAEATIGTRIFYTTMALVVWIYSVVAVVAPLIRPECTETPARRQLGQGNTGGLEDEPNPSYTHDACRWTRYFVLLGMNPWEADMSCRIVMSIVFGSIIGFER